MFLVLEQNQDEFGRGISRPVHQFKDETALAAFLVSTSSNPAKMEIYETKKLSLLDVWSRINKYGVGVEPLPH